MERLTAQEESVMLYIWKLGSCFIRDILNEMPDPKPPYTSVASVVRNLGKKEVRHPEEIRNDHTLFSTCERSGIQAYFHVECRTKLFHRFL